MAEGVADRKGLCRMEVLAGVGGLEYAVRKNREKKEESPDGKSALACLKKAKSKSTEYVRGILVEVCVTALMQLLKIF